eukprot:764167-Hanusia_phi.AAC.1
MSTCQQTWRVRSYCLIIPSLRSSILTSHLIAVNAAKEFLAKMAVPQSIESQVGQLARIATSAASFAGSVFACHCALLFSHTLSPMIRLARYCYLSKTSRFSPALLHLTVLRFSQGDGVTPCPADPKYLAPLPSPPSLPSPSYLHASCLPSLPPCLVFPTSA